MILSRQEQILIKTIRETGAAIPFLLIHLSNLYCRQGLLDLQDKRTNAAAVMKKRSDTFYQAYYEAMGEKVIRQNNTTLFRIK